MRHEELLRYFIRNVSSKHLSYHQGALLWRLWFRDMGHTYRKPDFGATLTADGWTLRIKPDSTWTLSIKEQAHEKAA